MNARRITAVASLVTGIAAGVCVFLAAGSSVAAHSSVVLSRADLARVGARVAFERRYDSDRADVPSARRSSGPLASCAASSAVAGQGASCRTRDGLFALADAPGALTHGPDAVSLADVHAHARRDGAPTDLVCSGASRTHHVLLVYLLPKDYATAHGDRFAEVAPQLRQSLATASGIVADRAAELQPGARRRIRVACGADGAPIVARVVLPRTAAQYRADNAGFGAIIADLATLQVLEQYPEYQSRATPSLRRVVGYYDADFLPGVAGQGTMYRRVSLVKQGVSSRSPLISRTVRNINNTPPQSSVAIAYGTNDVLGTPEPPRATALLHEMTHTMGAVQNEVPTTSGTGHCIDGLDVMCYDDSGPNGASYSATVCPGEPLAGPQADQLRYDCNGDTYFHPAPPLGNPLAGDTVWNLGMPANQTLATAAADTAVSTVANLRTSGRGTALRASWSAPAQGTKPAAYEVAAVPVDTSVPPAQAVVRGRVAMLRLAPRTTYDIVVTALDATAAAGPPLVVRRTTGPDTSAPDRVAAPLLLGRRRGQVRVSWNAVRDNVAVARYSVERVVGRRWRQLASVRVTRRTSAYATPWLRLATGSRQIVRVVALDARGNRSLPGAPLRISVP
jgi:hypothetical protein